MAHLINVPKFVLLLPPQCIPNILYVDKDNIGPPDDPFSILQQCSIFLPSIILLINPYDTYDELDSPFDNIIYILIYFYILFLKFFHFYLYLHLIP